MSGFCHKLATLFYKWGILDNEEDINPLRFSFELIITEMITYITMFVIGIVINRFYETVVYGVVFGILRKRIQGYHAKTFKMCFFLTIVNYIVVVWLVQFNIDYFFLNIILFIFLCVYFKKEEKRMILILTFLYTCVLILFYFFSNWYLINMCTLIYSTVIFMRVIGGQDENSDS